MWTYDALSVWSNAPEALFDVELFAWREAADAYHLEGTVRGFRKKDITIEVRGRALEARGERESGVWSKRRRSFRQTFTLPDGADASAIDARMDGDRLSIRIQKLPHARRRVVPLRVNGEHSGGISPGRAASDPLLARLARALRSFAAAVRGWLSGGSS
jgi:HSP20 family molecular chaperone IbpA